MCVKSVSIVACLPFETGKARNKLETSKEKEVTAKEKIKQLRIEIKDLENQVKKGVSGLIGVCTRVLRTKGLRSVLPPPPLEIPPPCNPPPPPRGAGRPALYCFAGQYLLWWFVFPICHTHVLALLSHYFESVTCVYSVIFSLQRRCTGCRVRCSDPRCFLPVTVYGTNHAHLVHMCWPLL